MPQEAPVQESPHPPQTGRAAPSRASLSMFESAWIWLAVAVLVLAWLPLLAAIRVFDRDPVRYRAGVSSCPGGHVSSTGRGLLGTRPRRAPIPLAGGSGCVARWNGHSARRVASGAAPPYGSQWRSVAGSCDSGRYVGTGAPRAGGSSRPRPGETPPGGGRRADPRCRSAGGPSREPGILSRGAAAGHPRSLPDGPRVVIRGSGARSCPRPAASTPRARRLFLGCGQDQRHSP